MGRMASNSNIKMGKARVFWMDGLVDAFFFLHFSQNSRAFRMKFKSPGKGPEKHALEHVIGVQKTVPRNGPLLMIIIARKPPGTDFLGSVFRIFGSRFLAPRI